MDNVVIIFSAVSVVVSAIALSFSGVALIKVLAFERTEYKIIPVENKNTSGLEALEKELEKLQRPNGDNMHNDLLQAGVDPDDLV